jgi:hypothetical protein
MAPTLPAICGSMMARAMVMRRALQVCRTARKSMLKIASHYHLFAIGNRGPRGYQARKYIAGGQ